MPTRPAKHSGPKVKTHGPKYDRQRKRQHHTGSVAWQRIREHVLRRDEYTCRQCGSYGDHVDHVDGDPGNNPEDGSNWQTLCRSCHSAKTLAEQGAVVLLPKLPRLLTPLTVVCGPPGSGKSTWVRERSQPTDLILDLDEIRSKRTGLPIYDPGGEDLGADMAERNRRIRNLSRPNPYTHCWLIASAPRAGERRFWRTKGRVVVLEVSAEECLRRIHGDPRRVVRPWNHWEQIVSRWWNRYVRSPDDEVVA